jgi:hypothetical protein
VGGCATPPDPLSLSLQLRVQLRLGFPHTPSVGGPDFTHSPRDLIVSFIMFASAELLSEIVNFGNLWAGSGLAVSQ